MVNAAGTGAHIDFDSAGNLNVLSGEGFSLHLDAGLRGDIEFDHVLGLANRGTGGTADEVAFRVLDFFNDTSAGADEVTINGTFAIFGEFLITAATSTTIGDAIIDDDVDITAPSITITNNLIVSGSHTIDLTSTGVGLGADDGDITIGNLVASTTGDITLLSDDDVIFSTKAGQIRTGGDVSVTASGTGVAGTITETTADADPEIIGLTVTLSAADGIGATGVDDSIEVDGTTLIASAAGGIFLNALGSGGMIVDIDTTAAGNVELRATENVTLSDLNADTNAVDVFDGTILISVAGGSITQTEEVENVDGDATTLSAAGFDITLDDTANDFGTVIVSAAQSVTLADTSAIDLGASSVSGDLTVTAAQGGAVGGDVITDSGTVIVGGDASFTSPADGDNIDLGDLAVAGRVNASVDATATGTGTLTLDTAASTLTLDTVSAQDGQVTLKAEGTDSNVIIDGTVSTDGGGVDIDADDSVRFTVDGAITSTTGNLTLNADADNADGDSGDEIRMVDGAVINMGSGTISLDNTQAGNNGGDIIIGRIVTTDTGTTAVVIDSDGAVIDGGDSDGVDIATGADGELTIDADEGIGDSNTLELTVGDIDITNTGSGSIALAQSGGVLEILDLSSSVGDDDDPTTGAISLTSENTVTITNAVSSTDGNIGIDVFGLAQSIDANASVTTDGEGRVTVSATDDVDFGDASDPGITAGTGGITVTADSDLTGAAGGAILISDGSVFDGGSGPVVLTTSENFAVSRVVTTDDITVTSRFGNVTDNLTGETPGAGLENLDGDNVVVNAATGIGDVGNDLDVDANTFAARNTTSGDIDVLFLDALSILTVENLGTGAADDVDLQTDDGSITVSILGGGVSSILGDINIFADGDNSDLTINAPVSTVGASGGPTLITLSADDAVFFGADGDVAASTYADVTVQSDVAGAAVDSLGAITMANGTVIDAGAGTITIDGDGGDVTADVTIGRLVTTNSSATAVTITAAAAVVEAGDNGSPDVEAPNGELTIDAVEGIGSTANPLETQVATLDVRNTTNTGTNDIVISEVDDVTIIDATQTTKGDISITAGGTITVNEGTGGSDNTVSAVSTGTITLAAEGAEAGVVLNDIVISVDGAIDIDADNNIIFRADGDVLSSTGNVTLTADDDSSGVGVFTMADGTTVAPGSGTIDIDAAGDVTIAALTTTDNSTSAVQITSTAGAVVDGGDGATDITATDAAADVTIVAATGVGSTNALETNVVEIDITNSVSGNIRISEANALNIFNIANTAPNDGSGDTGVVSIDSGTAADGDLTVLAGGTGITTVDGDIILDANQFTATADLNIDNTLTTTNTGDVTLTADDELNFAATGSVSATGPGSVSLEANTDNAASTGADDVDMVNGSSIDAGSGSVTVTTSGTGAGATLEIANSPTLVIDTDNDVDVSTTATLSDLTMTLNPDDADSYSVADSGALTFDVTDIGAIVDITNVTSTSNLNFTLTTDTGDIEVDTINLIGGDLSLTATTGSIDDALATTSSIIADDVTLVAGAAAGAIGATASINTAMGGVLNATGAGAGVIDINQTGSLLLGLVTTGMGTITLTASGAINEAIVSNVDNVVTKGTVDLTGIQGIGNISTLDTASTAVLILDTDFSFDVDNDTDLTDLTITVNPQTSLNEYDLVAPNLTFTVTDAGDDLTITNISDTTAGLNLTFTTDTGDVNVGTINVSGGTDNVVLTATDGGFVDATSTITADTLDITAGGSGSAIGTSAANINVTLVGTLTASAATGVGGIFITETSDMSIATINSGSGDVELTATAGFIDEAVNDNALKIDSEDGGVTGSVTLIADSASGRVGETGTTEQINVNTDDLRVTAHEDIGVASTADLTDLTLNIIQAGEANVYDIDATNLTATLVDPGTELDVTDLSDTTTGLNLNLTVDEAIDIATINILTGDAVITSTGSNIVDNDDNSTITADDLTLQVDAAAAFIGTSGAANDINVTLTGTLNASATNAGGGIFLHETDDMAVGTVDAGSGDIELRGDSAINDASSSNDVGDVITTGTIALIEATTGVGTSNGSLDLDAATITDVDTTASGGVNINVLDGDDGGVAVVEVTAFLGDIAIESTDGAGTITYGATGLVATDGNLSIDSTEGNVTIAGIVRVSNTVTRTIDVTLSGDDTTLTLTAAADVDSDEGDITFTADDMIFAGAADVRSGPANIILKPDDTGDAIEIGSADAATNDILELTAAELNVLGPDLTHQVIVGDSTNTGGITVTAATDVSAGVNANENLSLRTGNTTATAIFDGTGGAGGFTLTGNNLTFSAAGGIDVKTTATTVAAESTNSGDIFIEETDGVSIGTFLDIAGISTRLSDIEMKAGGTVTVDSEVNARSSGDAQIRATAGDVEVNADIMSTNLTTGNLGDGTGLLTLKSDAGAIITDQTGTIKATGAGGQALLLASTNIGTSNVFVQTSVTELAGDVSTASGGFFVTEADDLTVTSITNAVLAVTQKGISTSAGEIRLTLSGNDAVLTVDDDDQAGGTGTIRSTNGDIILSADNMTLGNSGGAGEFAVDSADGDVTLTATTASNNIEVGASAADSGTTLGLTDTEFEQVTATSTSTIIVGTQSSLGGIVLAGNLDLTDNDSDPENFALDTGGSISDDTGANDTLTETTTVTLSAGTGISGSHSSADSPADQTETLTSLFQVDVPDFAARTTISGDISVDLINAGGPEILRSTGVSPAFDGIQTAELSEGSINVASEDATLNVTERIQAHLSGDINIDAEGQQIIQLPNNTEVPNLDNVSTIQTDSGDITISLGTKAGTNSDDEFLITLVQTNITGFGGTVTLNFSDDVTDNNVGLLNIRAFRLELVDRSTLTDATFGANNDEIETLVNEFGAITTGTLNVTQPIDTIFTDAITVTTGGATIDVGTNSVTFQAEVDIQAGDFFLIADSIELDEQPSVAGGADADDTILMTGGGNVVLQTGSSARPINLGHDPANPPGGFDLSEAELQAISTTGLVTIGQLDGTGTITIGDAGTGGADLTLESFDVTILGGATDFQNQLGIRDDGTLEIVSTGAITDSFAAADDILFGTGAADDVGTVNFVAQGGIGSGNALDIKVGDGGSGVTLDLGAINNDSPGSSSNIELSIDGDTDLNGVINNDQGSILITAASSIMVFNIIATDGSDIITVKAVEDGAGATEDSVIIQTGSVIQSQGGDITIIAGDDVVFHQIGVPVFFGKCRWVISGSWLLRPRGNVRLSGVEAAVTHR